MIDYARAVALLRAGELVGIPTETVYGLGADARNAEAVRKIFAAKGRPADHPLIVHLPGADHLGRWAREIPEAARRAAEQFWPGPLTLILKRQPDVPNVVTGGQDTVGLRVPDHPVARELLRQFDGGIAAPSANRFGRISPTTAVHVVEELGERVALVLDGGPCRVGIESTIVDFSGASLRILRPGAIDAATLSTVCGVPVAEFGGPVAAAPRVSGSLEAHYAPRTPMRLVSGEELQKASCAARVGVIARQAAPCAEANWLVLPGDAAGFAHDLYAALRLLDQRGLNEILVEAPPDDPAWLAVADRLRRAACGAGQGQ